MEPLGRPKRPTVLDACCWILLLCLLRLTSGQSTHCSTWTTCSGCLRAGQNCAWCKSQDPALSASQRCNTPRNLAAFCPPQDVVDPQGGTAPLKDVPLSPPGAPVTNIVQLIPQEVGVTLRPGRPENVAVTFRQAEDYPVDLYYLMDLSNSMKDDKKNLEALGTILNTEMVKITRNFRLGFGSFVDKVTMPYVDTHPLKLESPCPGCAAPYGFTNHLALSENASLFVRHVAAADFSGNLDNTEGTFDAMMQSIVCGASIGWRDKARRILLVATDGGFHYAGDGKLGGIVAPNDCRCHLDQRGKYTHGNLQDYPSISQIRWKATENKINVLFAVTATEFDVYRELSSKIEGAHADKLTENSDNIVELIKEQYEEISSKVELMDNAPKFLKVSYYSTCLGDQLEQTNSCGGLRIGTRVDFVVTVELLWCPPDRRDWKRKFEVTTVGLNETLVVHVQLLCECECEQPGHDVPRSGFCNGLGTFECGVCSCPDDRVGAFCQCDRLRADSDGDDSKCRKDNSSILCSGRGICTCGECACFPQNSASKRVYGDFCECDNFSCRVAANDAMCAGHGTCDCRHCVCDPGWGGDDCACVADHVSCMAPNGEICGGNGRCDCGTCQCQRHFGGAYCEQNLTPGARCADLSACVTCAVLNVTGDGCSECVHPVEFVDVIAVEKENEHRCQVKDADDCRLFFVYTQVSDGSDPQIRAQRTKECPPPVSIALVSLSVIGSVVAVGVCLLLAWKVLTEVHDRREFAKFEKERQMAKWGKADNPIYKPTVSTFSNPTYGALDDE